MHEHLYNPTRTSTVQQLRSPTLRLRRHRSSSGCYRIRVVDVTFQFDALHQLPSKSAIPRPTHTSTTAFGVGQRIQQSIQLGWNLFKRFTDVPIVYYVRIMRKKKGTFKRDVDYKSKRPIKAAQLDMAMEQMIMR